MEFIEVEGANIDDAIQRALEKLGVGRERVEIEILSNSTRGFFGLGGRRAKVRATLRKPLTLEPQEEEPSPPSLPRSTPRSEPRYDAPTPPRVSEPVRPRRETRPGGEIDAVVLEQARAILTDLVRHMGTEQGRVAIEHDPEGPRLVIEGDSSGVLIGRRGQTLDALEYFINRIIARSDEGGLHIAVDANGYRARRRQALVELAKRVAQRARQRGRPVALNPMSPRDRRIIHLALENDPGLTTRSSGKGHFRKLLIIPSGTGRPSRAAATNSEA
jgi:spoIIIJ-associated protein